MPFETALLGIGVLTLATILFEIAYTYATQGVGFGFTANRPAVEKSPFGKRVETIYRNQVESVTYIAPVLIAAMVTGVEGAGAMRAAMIMVVGRFAFTAIYYTGVPFLRVPPFTITALATLYLAVKTAQVLL